MALTCFAKTIRRWVIAGAALAPSYASAQVLTNPLPVLPSDYPTELTGVADRYRPDYESQGVPLGGLTVRPTLGVGGNYNSNVFGAKTDKLDDFYLGVDPSLMIEGGDQGGPQIQARANAALRRYADQKRANETAFGGDLNAQAPFGGIGSLSAGASAHRYYERQESGSFPSGSLAPIRYFDIATFLRVRTGGSRIRATAAIDLDKTKFSDALASSGTRFDQGFRDRTVIRGSGRVEASFTSAASGFVEARYSDVNYRRDIISITEDNRDGKQAEFLGGVRIDSGKLRGTIAGGYTRRVFDSPQHKDFGGFALNGEMVYFASGLTTFTLTGYRNIVESGDPNISAQFTTGATAKVDHELLRYVILSGRVGYDRNTYQGLNRKDEVASVRGSVRYLVSRRIEVNAEAGYTKRTSSASAFAPEFNRFEFGLNLIGKL